MNREQLAHVLRAAAKIAGDEDIVVIGSQAILGSFSETDLPVEAVRSVEADLPSEMIRTMQNQTKLMVRLVRAPVSTRCFRIMDKGLV